MRRIKHNWQIPADYQFSLHLSDINIGKNYQEQLLKLKLNIMDFIPVYMKVKRL